MDDLRAACAQVASAAHWVQIRTEAGAAYAGSLPRAEVEQLITPDPREETEIRTAY